MTPAEGQDAYVSGMAARQGLQYVHDRLNARQGVVRLRRGVVDVWSQEYAWGDREDALVACLHALDEMRTPGSPARLGPQTSHMRPCAVSPRNHRFHPDNEGCPDCA